MHLAFHISPGDIVASEINFFAEVSNETLSFFFQNADDKAITGLSVFNFEKNNKEYAITGALEKVFNTHGLLTENFNKVAIAYAFKESILIPGPYYNAAQNNENLNLLFGDVPQGVVLTDYVAEQSLYNVYRVPQSVHEVITKQFSAATFIHQHSLLVKQFQHSNTMLKAVFYLNKIVLALQKEGKLQIVQSYNYITTDDVVYHLLNVCNQFNVKDVNVQLCGMIEKDSALFEEIKKYFSSIDFAKLPLEISYPEEIKKFSPHFFSHLFSFALCV